MIDPSEIMSESTSLLQSSDPSDPSDAIMSNPTSHTPTFLGYDQTITLSWLLLVLAITAETFGTVCMKLSNSFTVLIPSIMIFVCYAISFTLLPVVMRRIDLSITYAVWSGVGTFLTSAIGFSYFEEKVTFVKLTGIGLIIAGVVVLNYASDDNVDDSDEEKVNVIVNNNYGGRDVDF
jgi:small multidrug resistance pump